MKLRNKIILIIVCALMAILLGSDNVNAKVTSDGVWEYQEGEKVDQYGPYRKYDSDEVWITDCLDYASESLEIPSRIDGKKVVEINIENKAQKEYMVKKLFISEYIQPAEQYNSLDGIFLPCQLPLYQFSNLEEVEVDKNNNFYESKDGVLYRKENAKISGSIKNYLADEIELYCGKKALEYYPDAKKDTSFEVNEITSIIEYGNLFYKEYQVSAVKSGLVGVSLFSGAKNLKNLVVSHDACISLLNNSIEKIIISNKSMVCFDYFDYEENKKTNIKKVIICKDDCELDISSTDIKKYISMIYVPEGSKVKDFVEKMGLPYKLLSEYNEGDSSSTKPSQDKNYTNLPSKTINNQKYITGISLGKNTVNEILSSSNFTSGTTVKAYKYGQEISGNEKIGTGTVVKVYENGEEKSEYVAVVYGDTDGDGDMTAVDALAIVKNKTGEVPFTTDAQKEAAKISTKDDGEEAGAVDALAITLIIIGKANWNEKTGSVEYVGQSDDVVEAPTVSIDHELTLRQQ